MMHASSDLLVINGSSSGGYLDMSLPAFVDCEIHLRRNLVPKATTTSQLLRDENEDYLGKP